MKTQIFAAGRWQDADGDAEITVLPEEMDDAQAGKLPTRTLESQIRRLRFATVMSIPRIGYLDALDSITKAVEWPGCPRFAGYGVFWSHSLARCIEKALEWRDDDGSQADYILTADYDTFTTPEMAQKLVELLAKHPEFDGIVPMQIKRGGSLDVLASTDGAVNIGLDIVPIKTGHFGFSMFRRQVFEGLKKPWFLEIPDEQGGWTDGRTDPDIYFWLRAREQGFNFGLAPRVVIGHGEEVIGYPKIVDGKITKVYQSVNDWQNTHQVPAEVLA